MCPVRQYSLRPSFPSVTDVKTKEVLPPHEREHEMSSIFNIAKYWSVVSQHCFISVPVMQSGKSTQQAQHPDDDIPVFAVGGQVKNIVSTNHLYETDLSDQFFRHLVRDLGVSCGTLQACLINKTSLAGQGSENAIKIYQLMHIQNL